MERRCYRIEIYTPNNPVEQVEYYSTCSRVNLRKYANDIVDMVAWRCGGKAYWQSPSPYETEEEFIDRFAGECGYRIFDIPIEEYKAAPHVTFDCKAEGMILDGKNETCKSNASHYFA